MAISWVAGARQWLGKKARRSSVPNQEGEYGREAPEFFLSGQKQQRRRECAEAPAGSESGCLSFSRTSG